MEQEVRNLEELTIGGNFTKIPDFILHVESLQYVSLFDNEITNVDFNGIMKSSMKYIDLSGNPIMAFNLENCESDTLQEIEIILSETPYAEDLNKIGKDSVQKLFNQKFPKSNLILTTW